MKKVFLIFIAVVLTTGLILSGCAQPAPAPEPTPAPAPSPAPSPAPAPSPQPAPVPWEPSPAPAPPAPTPGELKATPTAEKYGGTLKFAWAEQSLDLGTPRTYRGPGNFFAGFCLQGLIRQTNEEGVYDPVLAESWELSPDKSTWTFHLRKGVKFSDGTPFNAQAVKYNYDDVINNPGSRQRYVTEWEVIDDYTIKAHLSTSGEFVWSVLAIQDFGTASGLILSPASIEKNGREWANTHPIGTGPFILSEYSRGQYIKYVKNPDYWREGLPYLDTVIVQQIKDPMTMQAVLLKGDIHSVREIDSTMAGDLMAMGKYKVVGTSYGHFNFAYNNTDPTSAWSDIRMREALEYAVNKEKIADALGNGFAFATYEIISGVNETMNPGTTPRKYDPAKAKQLMAAAGYADGIKVRLDVGQKFMTDFVVAYQADLAAVGIDIDINVMDMVQYSALVLQPNLPNTLRHGRHSGGPGSVLGAAQNELGSQSARFPGVKRADGYDELLAEALVEEDVNKMTGLVEEMERLLYGDLMFVPYTEQKDIMAYVPIIHNDISPEWLYYAGHTDASVMEYTWIEK